VWRAPRRCRPWRAAARVAPVVSKDATQRHAAPCSTPLPLPSVSARSDPSPAKHAGVLAARDATPHAAVRGRPVEGAEEAATRLHAAPSASPSPLCTCSKRPERRSTSLPFACTLATPRPEHACDATTAMVSEEHRRAHSPFATASLRTRAETPPMASSPTPQLRPCATSTTSPCSPIKRPPSLAISPPSLATTTPLHPLQCTARRAETQPRKHCCFARALHLAGAEGGRRSRPSRVSHSPSLLCTLAASPLHPSSPAAVCPCSVHSSAAEESPDLEHGHGGGTDHAAVDWSRPSTRNLSQSFPTPSAVDLRHLRHHPRPLGEP